MEPYLNHLQAKLESENLKVRNSQMRRFRRKAFQGEAQFAFREVVVQQHLGKHMGDSSKSRLRRDRWGVEEACCPD